MDAFEKSPWKNNLNHESSSLLIRWFKSYTDISVQQFIHIIAQHRTNQMAAENQENELSSSNSRAGTTSDQDRQAAHEWNRDRAQWGRAPAAEAGSGESLRARIGPLRERWALEMKNGSRELATVKTRAVISQENRRPKAVKNGSICRKVQSVTGEQGSPSSRAKISSAGNISGKIKIFAQKENQREPTTLITKRWNLAELCSWEATTNKKSKG
jgi:hypothetical protein